MIVFPGRRLVGLKAATATAGRDVADVRPQPSVTHPPDDHNQLGAIAQDNKVDHQAFRGLRLGRRWSPAFLRLQSASNARPSANAPASADVTIVLIMVHFLGVTPLTGQGKKRAAPE